MVRLHDDLHVLIQGDEKTQKAFHGKLPELTVQHLGYIGLADTEQIGSFCLFQTAFFHESVDLVYKLRLHQMLFRIRHADILEHIAIPGLVVLLLHGFIRSPSASLYPLAVARYPSTAT